MTERIISLESGTLWQNIRECSEKALMSGALQPIPTDYELVEQDGIPFLVRILTNLVRKEQAKKQQEDKKEFNPFLPYEEELFVSDISPTHLCLLNKYNVMPYHILIVTRLFEHQETWLTLDDFEALWLCFSQMDGLAFYNAGKEAGASQKHKHLQIVPFPLIPNGENLPIARGFPPLTTNPAYISHFPFVHAIAPLPANGVDAPKEAARITLQVYYKLLREVGLIGEQIQGRKQTNPYNLLATREWMMIVPRLRESFHSISVNSLGFAGALLVRNSDEMQILKQYGPITVLKNVAKNIDN